MPLLHWSPRSPYVRKVMVALHERGLADEVRTVRTHADPMIPCEPLMRINPLSKIPTLELDDGRVLFDSHVIATWIDQHGSGPTLFPHDHEHRLMAERDEALGNGILDFALAWLTEARLRPESLRSSAMVAVYRRKLKSVTTYLDNEVTQMAERPFDIGHLTIGVALCIWISASTTKTGAAAMTVSPRGMRPFRSVRPSGRLSSRTIRDRSRSGRRLNSALRGRRPPFQKNSNRRGG